jgi:hypothetical protein
MAVVTDIRNTVPPPEWGVTVSTAAIERLAYQWATHRFELPRWDYAGLPRGLADAAWYDVCVLACSVLACIWPPEGDEMWTVAYEGQELDDAPAIFSCFSRRIADGRIDFDVFNRLTAAEFFAGRGTLQLRDERWSRLTAVTTALRDEWDGTARNIVDAGNHDAPRIVELIAATVPGFDDAPAGPQGPLPFYKLARLATAMMSAGGTTPFRRLDRLPVYPDYMLPLVLRHRGVLDYAADLAAAVDSRRLIPKESEWELAIRWATVYAGDRLVAALRDRGADVTAPALDYFLWESAVLGPEAGTMGEHHRTITLAY